MRFRILLGFLAGAVALVAFSLATMASGGMAKHDVGNVCPNPISLESHDYPTEGDIGNFCPCDEPWSDKYPIEVDVGNFCYY